MSFSIPADRLVDTEPLYLQRFAIACGLVAISLACNPLAILLTLANQAITSERLQAAVYGVTDLKYYSVIVVAIAGWLSGSADGRGGQHHEPRFDAWMRVTALAPLALRWLQYMGWPGSVWINLFLYASAIAFFALLFTRVRKFARRAPDVLLERQALFALLAVLAAQIVGVVLPHVIQLFNDFGFGVLPNVPPGLMMIVVVVGTGFAAFVLSRFARLLGRFSREARDRYNNSRLAAS